MPSGSFGPSRLSPPLLPSLSQQRTSNLNYSSFFLPHNVQYSSTRTTTYTHTHAHAQNTQDDKEKHCIRSNRSNTTYGLN